MRALISRWNTPVLDRLRVRITAAYHASILRWVLFLVAGLSAFRGLYAWVAGSLPESVWLGVMAVLFVALGYSPFLKRHYRILTFALVNLYAAMEALFVWRGYMHFSEYFLYVSIYIFLASLMSGYLMGIITAILTTAIGIMCFYNLPLGLIYADSERTHNILLGEFTGHLFVSQIAVLVIVMLFHTILGKSEQEIARRRLEQAKYARRTALAESFGLIAHEINNTLAIMNGAFHLAQLNHKNKDHAARSRALSQMQEAEGRLKSFIVQVESLSQAKEENG